MKSILRVLAPTLKALESFQKLIATALSIAFFKFMQSINTPDLFAFCAAAGTGVVINKYLEIMCIHWPRRIRWVRRLLVPMSRIEGHWFQRIDNTDCFNGTGPFAYVCIEFDPETNLYSYYGKNFSPDFELVSEFRAKSIIPEVNDTTIRFHFSADLYLCCMNDKQSEVKPKKATTVGYGTAAFSRDNSDEFLRGSGDFIELGSTEGGFRFQLDRIPSDTFQSLVQQATFPNLGIANLVEQLSAEYTESAPHQTAATQRVSSRPAEKQS